MKIVVYAKEGEDLPKINREKDTGSLIAKKVHYSSALEESVRDRLKLRGKDQVEINVEWLDG